MTDDRLLRVKLTCLIPHQESTSCMYCNVKDIETNFYYYSFFEAFKWGNIPYIDFIRANEHSAEIRASTLNSIAITVVNDFKLEYIFSKQKEMLEALAGLNYYINEYGERDNGPFDAAKTFFNYLVDIVANGEHNDDVENDVQAANTHYR